MRYKVEKFLNIFGGQEFWIVIDTNTGKRLSEHRTKHYATIDSATRNAKEKENGSKNIK